MKKINVITYLTEKNRGSEFEVGYSSVKYLDGLQSRIFMPAFQFNRSEGRARKINSIFFKKLVNSPIIVQVGSDASEPLTPFQYRIGFILWLLKCRILLRNLKGIYWFVTLAQILSPAPFIFMRKIFLIGPVGGQAKFWHLPYLNYSLRIKNFILREIFYPISLHFTDRNSMIFCHPALVNSGKIILPAIYQTEKIKNNFIDLFEHRDCIIFVGRNLDIKMNDCVHLIFLRLSVQFPQYKFKIIGGGWTNNRISDNFEILSSVPRDEIQNIFMHSRLHVFLSLELAGFVLFEAVRNGCPNFTLKGFGADYLLNPSKLFQISPNVTSKYKLVDNAVKKIIKIINNDKMLKQEIFRQYNRSLNFTIASKFLSLHPIIKGKTS